MVLIEIITILIAISLVALPIILAIKNRKKGCKSSCSSCNKKCIMKSKISIS